VKPLASGGMAELLLARTSPMERPLVLKWIRPEQAIDGTFIETFVSEGRRAAQLHHPNIVEVHEVGREDGTHYLAMEYVHGDDLRKLLARLHERRAKLPVQHILAISTAVAQALQHAHDQLDANGQPVLHLSIKPANVLIAADGAVKLADFGIGRAALTEGRTDLLPAIVGYLSPEQCTGQTPDRRSDVFGLGILMYELAVGRRLFKGDNELVTMAAIVAGDIPAPTKLRGDLPKELEAVILKALARAPEDRFQTAQELHTALDKFATKAGVRGSLTTLAGYTKRLFGVRPEPWLSDEDQGNAVANDFDGSPKGVAVPPIEAVQSCSLPKFVVASDDSPIMRVKKSVSRDLPTEQLNLANLKAATADTSAPVQIPQASNGNGVTRVLPKPLANRPTPVPVAPARAKPKTVQIPVHVAKEESTKVMVQPQTDPLDETTNTQTTNTFKEEITKESRQMPAVADDTTVPGGPLAPPPTPPAPPPTPQAAKPPLLPKKPLPAPSTNGVNGKPVLVSLAGLRDADEKRHAAKRKDAERIPNPAIAGEIRSRPASASRMETDVDELESTITAVANPPPMVAATTVARDATEHVKPLPTGTNKIVPAPSSKKWFVLGGLLVAAAAAAVFAIGFTGGLGSTDDDAPAPVANTVDEPKKEEPKPEESTELRTADTPRTPRNSHVTADDLKPEEPKVEEPKVEEPKVEEPVEPPKVEEPKVAAVPPPEVEEPKPKKLEEPKPPKFVEPKDPSPPDEPVVVKPKPKPKPKPTAVAPKPKPKPTPVATKPKPKPKPTTAKPAGKWDPNALFPKK
jgi:serine/threonine protein kinase